MKFGLGFFAFFARFSEGFNYEKDWAITERGPPGSNFGYSLDYDGDSVFVGAPSLETKQNGRTGGVFKCSFGQKIGAEENAKSCTPVFDDQLTPEYNNSMFGMVVSSDQGF